MVHTDTVQANSDFDSAEIAAWDTGARKFDAKLGVGLGEVLVRIIAIVRFDLPCHGEDLGEQFEDR